MAYVIIACIFFFLGLLLMGAIAMSSDQGRCEECEFYLRRKEQ